MSGLSTEVVASLIQGFCKRCIQKSEYIPEHPGNTGIMETQPRYAENYRVFKWVGDNEADGLLVNAANSENDNSFANGSFIDSVYTLLKK